MVLLVHTVVKRGEVSSTSQTCDDLGVLGDIAFFLQTSSLLFWYLLFLVSDLKLSVCDE